MCFFYASVIIIVEQPAKCSHRDCNLPLDEAEILKAALKAIVLLFVGRIVETPFNIMSLSFHWNIVCVCACLSLSLPYLIFAAFSSSVIIVLELDVFYLLFQQF